KFAGSDHGRCFAVEHWRFHPCTRYSIPAGSDAEGAARSDGIFCRCACSGGGTGGRRGRSGRCRRAGSDHREKGRRRSCYCANCACEGKGSQGEGAEEIVLLVDRALGARWHWMPEGQDSSTRIRLVVGLGNPGTEYVATRHNIGFMVVDQFAAQFGSTWERSGKWDALSTKCGPVLLIKPLSFMNRSGYPLFAVAQFYKIAPQQILIVLDDF